MGTHDPSSPTVLGIIGDCIRYGERVNAPLLTEAVIFFYQHAWQQATITKYNTGQRAWALFTTRYRHIPHLPCAVSPLSEHELALAFFAAHLALTPSINKGSTVAAYLTHVRTL